MSKAVSRVMSWTIIYLDQMLPSGSSNLPENWRATNVFCSVLLRMGFTCALPVTGQAVVSYTALPPLPASAGGIFLLHCPWSRLRQMLSGTLPYEARTFLSCILSVIAAAIVCLTHNNLSYHI